GVRDRGGGGGGAPPTAGGHPGRDALPAGRRTAMIGPLRRIRLGRQTSLKGSYDVVIVGAGVHGLATAYELAKRGVRNVAVLDSSYLGSGASTRNTAIIRSNYRTSQGVAFYDESVKMYERLSVDLGFNVL